MCRLPFATHPQPQQQTRPKLNPNQMNRGMRPVWKELQEFAKMPKEELTHQQRVTRLYRNALRAHFNWAVQRPIFIEKAEALRAEFEANRKYTPESPEARYAVLQGERKLAEFSHPEPYVMCWMPGGSKFMRNSPPPPFPHEKRDLTGINTPVWPDMVPITFRPLGTIDSLIVDFTKKNME